MATTTRSVIIKTGSIAQTVIVDGQTVSSYSSSTTFTFNDGVIQSVNATTTSVIGNPIVTASFNGNEIRVAVSSKSANKSYPCTVTINYIAEKLKITKKDGTSNLISINFPAIPGRYKLQATRDDGSIITSSNYFYRYADNEDRTLVLSFGMTAGYSNSVRLTLPPTGQATPNVSARLLQDSITGYWTLDGNITNNNAYLVRVYVSIIDADGTVLRSGNTTLASDAYIGFAKIMSTELTTHSDILVNVRFRSMDNYVLCSNYSKKFNNFNVKNPSISFTASYDGAGEWEIEYFITNNNEFQLYYDVEIDPNGYNEFYSVGKGDIDPYSDSTNLFYNYDGWDIGLRFSFYLNSDYTSYVTSFTYNLASSGESTSTLIEV